MQKKQFRDDLYYRVNGIQIYAPPLRERKEDVVLLANHLLKPAEAGANKKIRGLFPRIYSAYGTV